MNCAFDSISGHIVGWPGCSRRASHPGVRQTGQTRARIAAAVAMYSVVALASAAPDMPQQASPDGNASPARIAGSDALALDSAVSNFWELDEADKRGAFRLLPYQMNYLLPVNLSSSVNREPQSPTRGKGSGPANARHIEAMMQISFRLKALQDVGLPRSDLWFAFTQRAAWQVFDTRDSSPFRSVDYEPEAFYVIPVPRSLGSMPGGVRLRMIRLGIAHQSNGQGDPLSRSWNRLYTSMTFERGNLALAATLNKRMREGANDDNPDLTRYIGDTEITGAWVHGKALSILSWRTRMRAPFNRGSLKYEWTFPVLKDNPQGLRWYLQIFHGYGLTLLDYNHRQTTLGLGLAIFQR